MHTRLSIATLLMGAVYAACDLPASPDPARTPEVAAFGAGQAPAHMAATGTFVQTGINSQDVKVAGASTIIEQTSAGTISGTLVGPFEDQLRVVIHPNGRFTAHFTIACTCTVDGRSGTLELTASDTGELVSGDVGAFAGKAVITGATGDLAGLRGVLEIAGTVDVPSGLSTYGYSGTIHFRP